MPKTPFQGAKSPNNRSGQQGQVVRASFRKRLDSAPTWDDVDPLLLANIICLVTTKGGSPTFGYTRNGSSLTIAVYYGGDRQVDYLSGADEVREYLRFLAVDYFQLAPDEISYYAGRGAEID